jgi:hypothetical protein
MHAMRVFLILLAILSPWAVVASEPDFEGIKRDTWYFFGYQAAAIGIIYVMPESISGWSEESKDDFSLKDWRDNVSNPAWDKDKYYINYVLHPYWGAAYFVRARERGYNNHQSFWYSALLSSLYEFGFEALFEQPSIQDLVVTPVFGSLLGAYFMRLRETVKQRNIGVTEISTSDKVLMIATDPLGGLNRTVDKWFGRDVQLAINPYVQRAALLQHETAHTKYPRDAVTGIEITLRF